MKFVFLLLLIAVNSFAQNVPTWKKGKVNLKEISGRSFKIRLLNEPKAIPVDAKGNFERLKVSSKNPTLLLLFGERDKLAAQAIALPSLSEVVFDLQQTVITRIILSYGVPQPTLEGTTEATITTLKSQKCFPNAVKVYREKIDSLGLGYLEANIDILKANFECQEEMINTKLAAAKTEEEKNKLLELKKAYAARLKGETDPKRIEMRKKMEDELKKAGYIRR